MNITQQLYQLQELDLDRDKHLQRLKEIQAQLGESEALNAARAQVAQIETELGRERARQQDLELEIQSLDAKLASDEERLYSGRVTNPKELTDLQKESIALRKHHGVLDERLLAVMLAVEESESALGQARQASMELQSSWEAQQQRLQQEQAKLKAELTQLDQARARHAGALAPSQLAQYESLRRDKGGVALALIEDGFCSRCGVEVSERKLNQIILDESPVFCGNCGRILME
jgi:predicted  nucleic acid-binding Zn-ribbon protein